MPVKDYVKKSLAFDYITENKTPSEVEAAVIKYNLILNIV